MSRYKYLLGADKENNLVFGQFEVREQFTTGKKVFGASFDVVRPFKESGVRIQGYYQNRLDNAQYAEPEWLLNALIEYDVPYSDLAETLAEDCYDITEIIDCSLFDECYTIGDEDVYFEDVSCGQCETQGTMAEYTDKSAYDKLISLWKEYHLKYVDDDFSCKVDKLAEKLDDIDEYEWIEDFLNRHIEEI